MNQKILFQQKIKEEAFKFLKSNKQRKKINFLNLHDLYQVSKNELFKKSLSGKENINFIDGFVISAYLSITNLKRVPRIRGPTFTRDFLSSKELSGNKKHFFILEKEEEFKVIQRKFPHLKNSTAYAPPFVKGIRFPNSEIKKMVSLINKSKTDYVWNGMGSPKQNILSEELFKKTNAQYFMNVGAALDFLQGKKAEAPLIVRELGIEWIYRLITDFKYSKKKVWRSLIGLKHVPKTKLQSSSSKKPTTDKT